MAKKFTFRLEPLLRIRSHKQEMAKQSLMQIISLRQSKETEIAEKIDYCTQLLRQKAVSSRANELQSMVFHIEFVENQIKNLLKERAKILEIEQIKREAYNKAKKEEKILFKLKEKKQSEYNQLINKEEILLLDEIAIRNFIHQES